MNKGGETALPKDYQPNLFPCKVKVQFQPKVLQQPRQLLETLPYILALTLFCFPVVPNLQRVKPWIPALWEKLIEEAYYQ